MFTRCIIAILGSLFCAVTWSADVLHEATVRKIPAGHEIAFTLTEPTDVTVRIVDAKGDVVRHLACGMVGLEKAATPFAPNALSQKIIWDGKDNDGKPVAVAECSALVLAGMEAKFDKFILWGKDGYARAYDVRIIKGNGDEWLVNQHWGVHMDTLRVFNSEGKFVRQIWPYSVNKPREALQKFLSGSLLSVGKPISLLSGEDWDGDRVPMGLSHNATYYFWTEKPLVVVTDGSVGGFSGLSGDQHLWWIDSDGFPWETQWSPPWIADPEKNWKLFYRNMKTNVWHVAAGPRGDVYFADALHHVVGHFRAEGMTPIKSFTLSGEEKLEAPREYLGKMDISYTRTKEFARGTVDDANHFVGPDDIALDKDGNICVLDGERVKIYREDGSFLKMADKSEFPGDPPVPQAVLDAGKGLRTLVFPHILRASRDGRIMVTNHRKEYDHKVIETDVEGRSFKNLKLPWGVMPYTSHSAFDAAGNFYVNVSREGKGRTSYQETWKYSPDGTRARFGDKDVISIAQEDDAFRLSKGLTVAGNGDIYLVAQTDKWTQKPPDMTGGVKFGDLLARGEKACQTRVDVYGPDGTLKKKGIVKSLGINDVAVDRKGNIYVLEGTMWHGAQVNQTARNAYWGGAGQKAWLQMPHLSEEQKKLDPRKHWNKRFSLMFRLVKFSPEGGVLDADDGPRQLWDYAGISGVSPWNCNTECPAGQIFLDADERIWVPDTYMYCIKAVDKAGNEIIRVGKYGNEDCEGGGGDRKAEGTKVVVDPEIPLARPSGMAVYKDYLFISDMYAHRVVRCRLEYEDRRNIALNP